MTTNTWNTNAGDGNYATDANWSLGHYADSTEDAVIIGSGSIRIPGSPHARGVDFSGFTGAIQAGSNGRFHLHGGNYVLSAGMTDAAAEIYGVEFEASGSLVSAGQKIRMIFSFVPGVEITLVDAAVTPDLEFEFSGTKIISTGPNLTLAPSGSTKSFIYADSSSFAFSGGAKLIFAGGTVGSEFDLQSAVVLPATEITGSGDVVQDFNSVPGDYPVTFASLTIQDAAMKAGVWSVIGAAVAHDASFADCDFSGGAKMNASDNCTGTGVNTNITFPGTSNAAPRRHLAGPILLRRHKRKRPEPVRPKPVDPPPPPAADPEQEFADLLKAMSDAFAKAESYQPPQKPQLPGIILAPMDALLRHLQSEDK